MGGATITENRNNGQRMQWIDVLKGLGTCLVVVVHMEAIPVWFYVITGPVMLPIFFISMGFTFNSGRAPGDFLRVNILQRLVIPLCFLSLAPIHIVRMWIADPSGNRVLAYLLQLVSGDVLWFIYCSIFAVTIFYSVIKLSERFSDKKKSSVLRRLLCLAFAAVGLICARLNVLNVCRLNTAFIVQAYLLMGYELREHNLLLDSKLMRKPWITIGACLVVYIGLVAVTFWLYPGQYFDLNRNVYYNLPMVLLMIITGNFALIQIIYRCKPMKILAYIGKNSLVYYSLHVLFFPIVSKTLQILGVHLPAIEWAGQFITAVVGCMICAELINRFAPFMTGRGQKRNKIAQP